jgi:hypothetical protein
VVLEALKDHKHLKIVSLTSLLFLLLIFFFSICSKSPSSTGNNIVIEGPSILKFLKENSSLQHLNFGSWNKFLSEFFFFFSFFSFQTLFCLPQPIKSLLKAQNSLLKGSKATSL